MGSGCNAETDATQSKGLAAVEAQFLAIRQDDALEPDDLLTIGELIAGARDHVAGFHRRLGPPVGLHPVDGGATDLPLLRLSFSVLYLKSHHRVRIGPRKVDDRALHR